MTTPTHTPPWTGPALLPSHPAPDPSRPPITIIYASSTGTAQDVAHRIAADLTRQRFHTTCTSSSSYDPTNLIHESHVLFIIATTGAGEFPTSAHSFWKFLLRDHLPSDILSDLHTAVFGLGDSSYPRFCWPARKLTRRLHALGAQDLLSTDDEGKDQVSVEADDQHPLGLEGTLMPWLDRLYATLEHNFPSSPQYPRISDDLMLPPRVRVRLRPSSDEKQQNSSADSSSSTPYIPPGWQPARLVRNERVTDPNHFQDVRAIEWERTDGAPVEYAPGDVACILPENDPKDIERVIKRMKWDEHADSLVDLVPEGGEPLESHLPPHPITLRHLLTAYLTPLSVPRRSFFAFIRNFTPPTHLEHEKLDEFLTPGEGTDEMVEYAQRVRRNALEVLEEFRSVEGVGIEWAVEMFGWMQERKFSIASAPAVSPNKIELAIAIVKYRTRLREPRRGICTAWLSRLHPASSSTETSFPFRIERGTMHLPTSSDDIPIILVGPGTGVAPMRSLAHERLARLGSDVRAWINSESPPTSEEKPNGSSSALPNIQLFLGCRHSQRDFLFGTEWARLASSSSSGNARLEYALAPSRENEDGGKVYVQDKIRECGRLVWEMLSERGAYFYISGSSGKMPEAVREAVKEAVMEHGGMEEAQAERYLDGLETKGRWQEECWS
ncbi:hypothetical protein CF327_g6605 [Tilletia walkeri]|nr:hypothetical protein CF327_g6605 [Tilletia walkeri]